VDDLEIKGDKCGPAKIVKRKSEDQNQTN